MFGVTNFCLDKENGGSYKLHNRLQAFFEFPPYIVSKGLKLLAHFFVKNSVNSFQDFQGPKFSPAMEKEAGPLGFDLGGSHLMHFADCKL